MRCLRLIGVTVLLFVAGLSLAQEDLSWIGALLPTGDDINIEKQILQGSIPIAAEGEVLNEGFSAVNAWDTIQDRDGFRRIRDERYEMLLRTSGAIYAGLSSSEYEDSIISVDSIHLSEELNDGFGLVCRAEGWENSYQFYISGDGYYNIVVYEDGRGRGLTDWTASPLINQGASATNSLTAVCVSDYLALYINGTLAAEVRDSTHESGALGMAVILFTPDSEVHIGFDNLRVWDAETDAPRSTSNATPTPEPTELAVDEDEQREILEERVENGGETLEIGDLQFTDSFDEDEHWERVEAGGNIMEVRGGVLRAFTVGEGADPAIIFSDESFENVVIEVTATHVEGAINNALSVICRGSEEDNTRGYYFNISSDGFYSVWASDGASFRFLLEWERSLAINLEAENRLTAVCIEDYFAFYVNDELLGEFYDDLYTEGTIGAMVFSYEGSSEIAFDNLLVWEAELD